MDDRLEGVLQFLENPVALQDVDNAKKQQESLALVVASWNAPGPEKELLENRLQRYTCKITFHRNAYIHCAVCTKT